MSLTDSQEKGEKDNSNRFTQKMKFIPYITVTSSALDKIMSSKKVVNLSSTFLLSFLLCLLPTGRLPHMVAKMTISNCVYGFLILVGLAWATDPHWSQVVSLVPSEPYGLGMGK